MGFFSPKVTCSICEEETGMNRYQLAEKGWICAKCFKRCGFSLMTPIKAMTTAQVKDVMQKQECNEEQLATFTATRGVGNFLHIDENNQQWLVPGKRAKVYNYSDIVDYELLEDGTTVTSGGVGRAVVGGALLGGVGAIVGGVTGKKKSKNICDTLRLKITVNDMTSPTQYIDFVTTPMKKESFIFKTVYQSAQECVSLLEVICESQSKDQPAQAAMQQTSVADELMKFKQLLDMGAITQEEYDEKKKQLLGV